MRTKRLIALILTFVMLMTSSIWGLSKPSVTLVHGTGDICFKGNTDAYQDVNIIIEKEGKRYFLDTTRANAQGEFSFKTILPLNKEYNTLLTSKGEKVEFVISTTPDQTGTDETKPGGGGSSGTTPEKKRLVTVSVDRLTVADKIEGRNPWIIPKTQVELKPNDTAWDVVKRLLDERQIEYSYNYKQQYDSIYVEAIDGDGEFDHGQGSGWMYNVNGYYPKYGASRYTLDDGDSVEWRYTTNLGADLGDASNGAVAGGEAENSGIVVPNDSKVTVEIPKEGQKDYQIVLGKEYDRIQEIGINIPKTESTVSIDLSPVQGNLPQLNVTRDNNALVIEKGTSIISGNPKIQLFNNPKEEVNKIVKNYFKEDLPQKVAVLTSTKVGGDETVLFSKPIQLIFKEAKASEIAIIEKDELIPIKIYATKEEGRLATKEDKKIHYAYKQGNNLIVETNHMTTFVTYSKTGIEKQIDYLNYKDVDRISDWAKESVRFATEKGFIVGYNGCFNPKNSVTRAEFIAMITNALYGKTTIANQKAPFKDVSEKDWFSETVSVAYEKGIIKGDGDLLNPNDTITREQMACILVRALQLETKEANQKPRDFKKVSPWAKRDVETAYAHKLIGSVGNSQFAPVEKVTREMATVIVNRSYEHTMPKYIGKSTTLLAANTDQTKKVMATKKIPTDIQKAIDTNTTYLIKIVNEPQFGSIGGEWAVFGLARHGAIVPKDYYENYYKKVANIAKEEHNKKSRNWKTKVTETQRLAIAVTAIGKEATNINGINLVDYSFNKAKNMPSLSAKDRQLGNRQGLNELVFGLITMNLKSIKAPKDAAITQDQIITKIINDYTTKDGGFNLTAHHTEIDVDMTAMVIQALAPYYKNSKYTQATQAIDKALKRLSEVQNKEGGFNNPSPTSNSKDSVSLESTAQVVVALCSLGINPTEDARFIKNEKNPMTDLMTYAVENGGFEHVRGEGVNQMATEQGYYALVAYERLLQGKSKIYDMRDVK